MLRLPCVPVVFVLLLASGMPLRAQNAGGPASRPPVPAAAADAALPADLQAELAALQQIAWHPSTEARASVGWRDNVLLSPFAPIARGFGRGEIDVVLLRPMRDRWEFVSFFNGDVLRYFSPPPESAGEQQWSLHTEGRWQPVSAARFSLKATGYLRDMVIDLSETEARRVVAPTQVRGGYVGGAVRFTLPAGFRFEPAVQLKRNDYRAYAGDYGEVRSGGRLEWRRGEAWMVSAGWFESRRRYSQRTDYTAGGRPLPGTLLRFRQHDGELKARAAWGEGGAWTATATVGRLANRDEASGYFNYDQRRARLELAWQRAGWRATLDGEAKAMTYLVQTVGAGLAPPARVADDFETTLRLEREINPRWTFFAEHRWERSRSNELEFSYRANTALAGVQRSF